MPEPAVDDVGLLDAGLEAGQAGLDLGDHPLVDHAPGDQVAAVVGGEAGQEAVGVVAVDEDAGGVGQEDELLGLEGHGDGGGGGVGVHVVEAALVVVLGERGEDGDDPGQAEVDDRVGVDLGHLADPAQVDRPAVGVGQGQPGPEEALVGLVVQARGPAAELADVADDVLVDLLGQHPGDDRRAWRRRCTAGPGPIGPRGPAFSIAWVIALPPPWTTTGRIPTVCMNTTSTSRARSASGLSITEPPSLMTVNLPWNWRK